jgi:hypothetical protein
MLIVRQFNIADDIKNNKMYQFHLHHVYPPISVHYIQHALLTLVLNINPSKTNINLMPYNLEYLHLQ